MKKKIEDLEKRIDILEKQAAAGTATAPIEIILEGKITAQHCFFANHQLLVESNQS